tara:strand:- start:1379 stop:2008 length:630 start_codon:yes stop_codon:yes gene_type:complete
LKKINVLIAFGNTLIEAGIKSILIKIDTIQNIYCSNEEERCNDIINKYDCKLLIIFNEHNRISSLIVNRLKSKNKELKILLISDQYFDNSSDYQIDGFLTTDCDDEEIREAINSINSGQKVICNKVIRLFMDKKTSIKKDDCESTILSKREQEIITLIAGGSKNTDIAEELFISPHTVATHRKNIMKKLGVNKISGLIHYAIKTGLIKT